MLPDTGLKLFLISELVCAATAEPVVCPDSSQWSLRTRAFCNSTHPSLNCLYEETTSTFVQFCTTRPDFQRTGYKFIIRGNIDGIVCEKNRFQPIKFWTNGSSDCILEKTRCDEPGQVIHIESDSTSDRTCRCDYTKGFAFVSQRQNCFCDPSLEDCSCFLKPCSKFQVMTPDYNCINAKDWTGIFKCPVITKTMTTSATTRCPRTTPDMNRSPLMSMVVKKFNALTVTVLIVTTVMLIIVSTTCGTNIKKCCRNLNMTEKELDERYERIKKDELKGNLNMTETELDERSELMRKENIKDKMKLMANYREIITNVNNIDMVKCLKTLTDKDNKSINLCTGRIHRNIALLDIVIEKGVEAYNEFIGVLHQSNSDLANKIENTKERHYQLEYEDKFENIYNEKIPKEVREFHDGKIQDWKLKDNMIIDTRASDYIRESLTTNNCVVVVGSPGSGKSSILHHVALSFVEKSDTEDYEIIPVIVDPSKVLEYHNDCRNQIFVIDNLCGKDKVNNQLIDLWKLDIKNIDGIINQVDCYEYEAKVIRNKKTKLLISCNSSIFESEIFLPLKKYLESFICELSKFRLTEEERVAMLTKYALEPADTGENFTSQDETSIDNFDFPLLCELSARKRLSEIKKLFREPHKTITNDLRNIQKTKPLQFCAIVLCTIFNNEFNKKWLNLKYDAEYIHTIDAVNEVFRELNLEHKNEREHIRLQFDEDKLEWLSKSGDTYHFVHESIFNIASVICVESYTQCFINHATSSFLAERFELANFKDGNSLNDTFIKQYFNRLIRDLGHGITYSTFQNIQLKSEKYRKDFIEYCRNRELKFREILGNLKSINNVKDRKVKRPFCADSDCRKGTFCFDFHSENSPLIECALQGYDDMVELLLDMKCDANETDPVGRSPLFVASAKGHIKIVKRLVENDGHLKIEDNKKNKADITMSDNRNRTSLHIACEEGHKPVIEYLVQKGANISVCDVDGNSLLHMACVPGKREVVELLLKEYKDKGKETEIENTNKLGQTPIIVASSTEGHDVVKLLLQYNANIQATDNRGFTSLLTASMYGFTKTVQFLINEKAKILHLDNEGRTALFIACKKGHLATAKVLIKEGKTDLINKCDWHHKSPFYIACSEGRIDIMKVLIENEADINICDENNKSPLHVACERSHDKIVQFLLENKANKDTGDRHRNLPLHVACKVGNLTIVQLLYQPTVDNIYLYKTNQWNEKPLDIARKEGYTNIVNYFNNNIQQ